MLGMSRVGITILIMDFYPGQFVMSQSYFSGAKMGRWGLLKIVVVIEVRHYRLEGSRVTKWNVVITGFVSIKLVNVSQSQLKNWYLLEPP